MPFAYMWSGEDAPRYPASPGDEWNGGTSGMPLLLFFTTFLGHLPLNNVGSRGVTGVGRELRFNCWMTMDPGTTEAFGALFHRGARLGHPGSWSQDRLGTDGGVLPLARIGRFVQIVALWVTKPS